LRRTVANQIYHEYSQGFFPSSYAVRTLASITIPGILTVPNYLKLSPDTEWTKG